MIERQGVMMKCLHCGYCCLTMWISIVVDPERGIVEGNIDCLDGTRRCPHLEGEKRGSYFCRIHHYKWFVDTPCGRHSQFENGDTNCRLGEHFMKRDMRSV